MDTIGRVAGVFGVGGFDFLSCSRILGRSVVSCFLLLTSHEGLEDFVFDKDGSVQALECLHAGAPATIVGLRVVPIVTYRLYTVSIAVPVWGYLKSF